jgi:uncharacterized membrane protein YphA (DoxX/SURF4 family)
MYLLGVLLLLVLIINIPKVFGNRWLTQLTRIAVGGLFIFSGFIKANDPVGFSIKLEEYFDVFGEGFSCDMKVEKAGTSGVPCLPDAKADETATAAAAAPHESSFKGLWEFFHEHALFLAIFICGFEMAVGLFLLLGLQVRWTLLILLLMIIFFSFLTFYSACCNKVTSCGCFGDAIKLTPWESFWKDLILLILVAILYVGEKNIQPLFRNRIILAGVAGIGLFASFAFPVYTWRHLPVIDFRPYKIGTNLYEASHDRDPKVSGCEKDSMVITYYYKHAKTGAMMHFRSTSLDSFPSDTLWEYYCRHDFVARIGNCKATVLDFNLTDPETGETLNDSLLQRKGVQFFLIMYDIDKAERDVMGKVNAFYADAAKAGTPFYALSNASLESANAFRKETGAKYPMLSVDGTALKTAIRSNPGLMMLKDGVVTDMWHANDFPAYSDAMAEHK